MMAIAMKMINALKLKLEIHGQDKLKLEPILADIETGHFRTQNFS